MRDAAGQVQKAFDEKDLDTLASLCHYPLTVVDQNGSSKVTKIQLKGQSASGSTNLVQAAEQFQRTFYYRDLETLSKQCTYPMKVYLADGTIQDISSGKQLMDLGESKLFTDELVNQVNQIDASTLQEANQKVQVGTICGFWMVKQNGEWKIDTIFQ